MTNATQPKTPAQRRAVELIQKHGRVYVAGRGRFANIGADVQPNEVSGQMSVWLQRSGWGVWDLSGYAALVLVPQKAVA